MYCVILEFDVIEGKEEEFRDTWTDTTKYIYHNFGGLGSRLHKSENSKFIAYAQWPDKETYDADHKYSEEGMGYLNRMRTTLKSGKATVLQKLNVDIDLIKNVNHE